MTSWRLGEYLFCFYRRVRRRTCLYFLQQQPITKGHLNMIARPQTDQMVGSWVYYGSREDGIELDQNGRKTEKYFRVHLLLLRNITLSFFEVGRRS